MSLSHVNKGGCCIRAVTVATWAAANATTTTNTVANTVIDALTNTTLFSMTDTPTNTIPNATHRLPNTNPYAPGANPCFEAGLWCIVVVDCTPHAARTCAADMTLPPPSPATSAHTTRELART